MCGRSMLLLACILLIPSSLQASEKEFRRLQNAAAVLEQALEVPEGIPKNLLNKAECVIVIPSAKEGAFVFGGMYGRGAMLCRSGEKYQGFWGPPAMYALEGGSFGLQLGGQEVDFIFLVMNPQGADSLLGSKVKLGADASVAGGPKGRSAMAATDAYMRAEILTYSRARGLFAGISVEGSTLRPDGGANKAVYGPHVSARDIVKGKSVFVPAAGRPLVDLLQVRSPRNESD